MWHDCRVSFPRSTKIQVTHRYIFLFSKLVQDITILIKSFTFTIPYEFNIMSLEFLSANCFFAARTCILIFIIMNTHSSCQFIILKLSLCFCTLYLPKAHRNIDKLVFKFKGWLMIVLRSCTSSNKFNTFYQWSVSINSELWL